MGFESVNEIDKFSFDDCVVNKFEVQEGQLYLELEALIVKAGNSQNTNYTESYAGPTTVRLKEGKILSGIKEGYKYYDANEVLLSEEPDQELDQDTLDALLPQCVDVYLFSMEKDSEKDGKQVYDMEIEFPGEDQYDKTSTDIYELKVEFEKAVFSWERYLNRVES